MTGTVSPQLPSDAQLPVGAGWSSVHGSLCALLREWGRVSRAVPGHRDTSQGSQCHLVGDSKRSGAAGPPAPGAVGHRAAQPGHLPSSPACSSPIPTGPCSTSSSPPTPSHPCRLCKAPPRQGRKNLLQVQLVNHIKSSPVESLGVHPAQGEHRAGQGATAAASTNH